MVKVRDVKWVPVFNDAINPLNDLKLNWQIGNTTLLGLYRTGNVLPEDTALWFDVFVDESFKLDVSLHRLFENMGFSLQSTISSGNKLHVCKYLHIETQIEVVVSFFYYDDVKGVYANSELSIRPVETVVETQRHFVDAMIDYVEVPVEVDAYLAAIFEVNA